jgi:Secretion system C-terminal sorting domain
LAIYLIYGLNVEEIVPSPPFDTKLIKSTFSRLDNDFNIEWVKKYGIKSDLSSEIMFYDFKKTIDGNFIAVGRTSTETLDWGPTYERGWLMKFSINGDSIWSRQDTSDVMPIDDYNQQRFGGVGVLSSGSIVAGGYVTRAEDNSSYIWLIKTTNDGCIDTLYCGLVSGTQSEPPKVVQPVSIYPNPASNLLHLTITDMATMPYSLSVLDISGRVCSASDKVAETESTMDVSTLPAGLYLLCFKFANGEVLFKKLNVFH